MVGSTNTKRGTENPRIQLDSAHQIGSETTLQSILIVVESGGTYRGKNKCCRNFSLPEIGPEFACTSTTSSPMDEWMLQAHSAHQTGLKLILQAVLILVESGGRGGRINGAGIFHSQKLGPILPVPQEPALLWTNGWCRRIQRIK